MTGDEAEHLAACASRESGLDDRPRCDPRTLAVSYCGLALVPWPRAAARLVDGAIWYPSDAPDDAQAYYVAHEVGHDLLRHADVRLEGDELERAASRIGCALLLPRRAYSRDLAAHGWDLPALRALWPLASAWVHARRIAEIDREAVVSRWRGRRALDRVSSDGIDAGRVPTPRERELGRAALAGERIVERRAIALPASDGTAIVICGVDAL